MRKDSWLMDHITLEMKLYCSNMQIMKLQEWQRNGELSVELEMWETFEILEMTDYA